MNEYLFPYIISIGTGSHDHQRSMNKRRQFYMGTLIVASDHLSHGYGKSPIISFMGKPSDSISPGFHGYVNLPKGTISYMFYDLIISC